MPDSTNASGFFFISSALSVAHQGTSASFSTSALISSGVFGTVTIDAPSGRRGGGLLGS